MTHKFRALKPLKIGDKEFWLGDVFSMPDDRDWLPLIKLELAELVNGEGEEISPQPSAVKEVTTETAEEVTQETVTEIPSEVEETPLTNDEKHDIIMPEVIQAGPAWKKVMLGKEQIGKSVRTDEEAQAIIDEWLDEQTK